MQNHKRLLFEMWKETLNIVKKTVNISVQKKIKYMDRDFVEEETV